MSKQQGVKVTVQKHHTWRGKAYEPGESYVVDGDASQTVDQYLDTLKATGFAIRDEDKGTLPNIVDEVGAPDTSVAPLSTENIAPASQPEASDAKPADAPNGARRPKLSAKRAVASKPAKSGGKKK